MFMKVKGATFLAKRRSSSPNMHGHSGRQKCRNIGWGRKPEWAGVKDNAPLWEVFFSPPVHFTPQAPSMCCVVTACWIGVCCASLLFSCVVLCFSSLVHYLRVLVCRCMCGCALFVVQLCRNTSWTCPN